jgi:hypothetical protein
MAEWGERYWQHHCNPLATPKNGTGFQVACEPQKANGTDYFQCYLSQASL